MKITTMAKTIFKCCSSFVKKLNHFYEVLKCILIVFEDLLVSESTEIIEKLFLVVSKHRKVRLVDDLRKDTKFESILVIFIYIVSNAQ